jgi:UrcA family protein
MHNAQQTRTYLERFMFSRALSRSVNSVLVAAVCSLVVGTSQADPADTDAVAVKVSSAGLDLNSAAGAHAMFSRLATAAEAACGVESEFDALRTAKFERCYRTSLSNAIRALNQQSVTHVYVEHYPRVAARYGITDRDYVAVR